MCGCVCVCVGGGACVCVWTCVCDLVGVVDIEQTPVWLLKQSLYVYGCVDIDRGRNKIKHTACAKFDLL